MSHRQTDINAAENLPPGAEHYRAYVGPPQRYGLLGLSQMALLFHLGLKETDKVLDFGCGSLRLGRLLIPFLRRGHYFGIEPNIWLVEDGFTHELGADARALKVPHFSDNADFDCGVFGVQFDFIMAQSIITHSGWRTTTRLLESAAASLSPTGILALSYIAAPAGSAPPAPDWTYPNNIAHDPIWLADTARRFGLDWREIAWRHPGARWAIAGKALPASISFSDGDYVTR